MSATELTVDQWEEKYKPITNHIDSGASWTNDKGEGLMFETHGAEYDFICQQPDNNVWTWVDGDEGSYIITGMAFVNRIGYFVTSEPWTDHIEIQVDTYEDSDDNRTELENELATIMRKKENAIEILVGRLSSVTTTEQLSVLIKAEEQTL